MSLKFFNLHQHTGYSMYDGFGDVEDYTEWMLKNAGEDSGGFAITDHGHLNAAGSIAAAQKKYKNKGMPVKVLWGLEAYYIPSVLDWQTLKIKRDEEKKEEKAKKKSQDDEDEGLVFENEKESKAKYFDPFLRRNHLVLVAHNQKGLKNLFRLVSRSHREGFYKKPRIDLEMLRSCNEGLIASTACLAGIPSWCSMQCSSPETAHEMYDKELSPLMEIFGKERFYLELQFNKIKEQQDVNRDLIKYAKKTGYKLIVTADAHYANPNMWKERELYRMLGFQLKKQEIDMSVLEQDQKNLEAHLYLKNGDQLFQSYKESDFGKDSDENDLIVKEAIERTYDIAHNFCEFVYPEDKIKLPKSSVTDVTPFGALKKLCIEALKAKKLDQKKEYVDRTIYELSVIQKLGVSEYFLTKKEILDVLRKHMLIGPGRGSGAGSLVNYLLAITLVDPIKDELLFERFLSPSRLELPDVDTDVERREEALDILKNHFGQDNVIAISNYNRLQLKSLVKDLSRLYKVDFAEVNAVTTVMEKEAKDKILDEIGHDQKLYEFTYEKAKKYSPTFRNFIEKYPLVGEHIENLFKEIKSIGKHAGGILIVPDAESCLPVIRVGGVDQSPITEGITAQHLKYFGLVKFDILGLSTLKIIRRCIELILKKQGNENPTIDDVWAYYYQYLAPDVVDKNDSKVFESTYNSKKFPSIFQFEKENVQNFCYRAQPQGVNDISAITALWRPGPLKGQADKRYLHYDEYKLKKEHPIIQEILGSTRGLLLYQEQFMLLANQLAGFSLEEADQLRKILVKPSHELGEELKKKRIEAGERFIKGCIEKGLTEERAHKLWDEEIMGFISYGFNKSHSQAYAYNSYECAWLYTYYPTEWIKACLEKDPEQEKTINLTRNLGYKVSKVDVNYSTIDEWNYANHNNTWLPPLSSLKGLGDKAAEELVTTRHTGKFESFDDFFWDSDGEWRWSKLNKKCIEVLFKAEAFEQFEKKIGDLHFENYKHMHDYIFSENKGYFEKFKKRKLPVEFFTEVDATDWTTAEKIIFQKEIVGFYDKNLIVNRFLKTFKEFSISAIDEYGDDPEEDSPKSKVWGIVENLEQKETKNKKIYYVVTVSGFSAKQFKFRAWLKPEEATVWQPGNVLFFSLDYSTEWGYSLRKNAKYLRITK